MLVGASGVPVQDPSEGQMGGRVVQDVAVHVREGESGVGDGLGKQDGVQHLKDQLLLEGVVEEAHALDVELQLDVLHHEETVPRAQAVGHGQAKLEHAPTSLAVLPDVASDHVLSLTSEVGHHTLDFTTEPSGLPLVVLDQSILELLGLLLRTPAFRPDVVFTGIKIRGELIDLLLYGC